MQIISMGDRGVSKPLGRGPYASDSFPPPEEKVWTVLAHNGTAAVAVQGSSLQRPHVTRFNYGASAEQLRAVVTGSEHCQQEVVYNCKKSRLFNTKGQCYFSSCRRRAAQLTAIVLCFWYQAVT